MKKGFSKKDGVHILTKILNSAVLPYEALPLFELLVSTTSPEKSTGNTKIL